MQFPTVRIKEKDYYFYLQSEKLVHSNQNHEKYVSQLFGSAKNWFLYFEPLKHCFSYLEREKRRSLLFADQKIVFTTVRSKEKGYDIYLFQKTGSPPVEARNKCFPAIMKWKKLVPCYFEPDKHCCSYLEREKSGSLLFGDQKMQFTTVRSKEKDYDIYLKSEKLVHINQEHEKNVSQLFRSAKNWFLAISSLTNTVAAIWREKKVDPCYLETKKCSSQLLGARKKIMTSI